MDDAPAVQAESGAGAPPRQVAAAEEPVVRLEGVSKSFDGKLVLDRVTLTIPARRTTAIIGPSGTGKSVLLKHIVGLLRPDEGRVLVFGQDIAHADDRTLYAIRRRFGMLFQDGALFDSFSVGDNVGFPLERHRRDLDFDARRIRVEEKLEWVGLPGFYERSISSLSGGQRKRVGLARAIVMEPEVVLFDEPNSGLDPLTSDAIDELVLTMKKRLGITFIIISHDIVGTVHVADLIGMLHEGRLVEYAPTADFVASSNPVIRNFLRRNLARPYGAPPWARVPPGPRS
jgi:phospholipid/cholesterol/gamma-HCH transport system ATP-binding protein